MSSSLETRLAFLESRGFVDVIDLGDRVLREVDRTDKEQEFVLALVLVPGDRRPRWIAEERLAPPKGRTQRTRARLARWRREIEALV